MKILSAGEIRAWDQYTILHEPVSSLMLMERAAGQCFEWLMSAYPSAPSFTIFCGKGNNGGDGLAIARMLLEREIPVVVFILEFGHKGTEDFQTNLALLHQTRGSVVNYIQTTVNFHPIPHDTIIIDALFGSGLNRKLEGVTAELVDHINQSGCTVISIDIPSGLFVDSSSLGNPAIQARHTLSFQCYKPAFLVAENGDKTGQVHVLDIGLHKGFIRELAAEYNLLDDEIIHHLYKPRNAFSHKGQFGHALLIAGSHGKNGAAVLAAKACLRTGAGLVTCHIPKDASFILQTAVPEAMVITDNFPDYITAINEDIAVYNSIGIGPGIGQAEETVQMLRELLTANTKPMVLDADALNILAANPTMMQYIPAGSVLTPHPKEFERLFGKTANEFDRVLLAVQKAKQLSCVIVLKGHHTLVATPEGKGYFNSTGNAGMAKGGSGDVLTGMLTALLAQGYQPENAAMLGVYLHGLAGDLASVNYGMEALLAGDIINFIGQAFKKIE